MKELTNEEIRDIQIKILKSIDSFCSENGIQYFLTGGTLLGAIRHNGYIPWDDDIDIVMYRDDYNKFIKLYNAAKLEYYAFSLLDSGYNYPFCKVCDNSTLLTENNIRVHEIDMGVFVDIFPLDKIPENIDRKELLNKLHKLDKLAYGKSFRIDRLKYKTFRQRLLIISYKILGVCVSKRYIAKKQEQIATQFGDSDTDWYGAITASVRKDIPRLYRPATRPIEHVFEDCVFIIPNTYDSYLRDLYGDYMKMPPKDQQVSNHSFTVMYKTEK